MSERVFRVNMSNFTTKIEDVPKEWITLGGRAMTSTVVGKDVPPTCHPLGEDNVLVFSPGILSGTGAANSGRLSAGAKSPLTGTIKESNAGGTAAQMFARMGVKALIIEGMPEGEGYYSLLVTKDGVTISEETELVGKGNFAVVDAVTEKFGRKIGVITIGPAGEMKMAAANISVKDPDGKLRSHGRGGLGAVMGSKKIKYIAIDATDASGVQIADPEKFKAAARVFSKALIEHPTTGEGLPTYGTDVLINILNEAGGLPTKNFTAGEFEGHDSISGETMHDIIVSRGGKTKHGCHPGCIIQCSQVYNDKQGKYMTSGFEYETIWALGADCCIEDLDQIAEADNIMDDIGVDSIETSVAFGVAMEAGILEFGDGTRMLELMKEIGEGTPLGRVLGSGAGHAGKVYGVTRVPVVKNQAIPAYDPRAVKGIGITYATSTQGADHTMGYCLTHNVLGCGGYAVDPLKKEGQVELSKKLQIATATVDSSGMCTFVQFAAMDKPECQEAYIDLLSAKLGTNWTQEDIEEYGKSVLRTEHEFNLAAGFTNKDDRLPEFFSKEVLKTHDCVWDFTGEEIDEFWNF